MANKQRTLHPNLRIFDSTNPEKLVASFTAVPSFFVDDLMRIGQGIPAAFWKMTFVLMRGILSDQEKDANGNLRHTYTWKITVEDFDEWYDIGDRAVQDWTNAYAVSGLFHITRGQRKRDGVPPTPTVWRYNPSATKEDWVCFVVALSEALNHKPRMKRSGRKLGIDCAGVFKLALAVRVDEVRQRQPTPLPCVNNSKIDAYIQRGYGRREGDLIRWTYAPEDNHRGKVLEVDFAD